MSFEQQIAALQAENEALKAAKAKGAPKSVSFKVSEKGAVSAYGLGRFPVTLYKEQWEKLLDRASDLRSFIAANSDSLKVKGE